jgi:uncharacterized protein
MHGAAYKNLSGAVDFLASHGAKVDVCNQKNKHGWTPLTIAVGYRFGDFKPSPETAAAISRAMLRGCDTARAAAARRRLLRARPSR